MTTALTDSLWIAAGAGAAGAAGVGVLAHGLFHPRSCLFFPVVWHGPRDGDRVAITFDDGPWPGATEPILDALAHAGARATFFVIGRYAAAHPHLVRRMHDEGHLVGNHSFDHHRAGLFRGRRYWADQIARTDAAIAAATGEAATFFRPPMGFKSPPQAAAAHGRKVVAWSRRGFDGLRPREERVLRSVQGAHPGDIILLHDGRDPASRRDVSVTAVALPRMLGVLAQQGLRPVRVDELLTGAEPVPSDNPRRGK